MSSKARARQYAANAVPKGHAKALARKQARQHYARNQGLPWFKIGVGTFAIALIAVLAFSFIANPSGNYANTGYGTLTAQSTTYNFGDVPWQGGSISTQFPLTVEGDVTVNDIVST